MRYLIPLTLSLLLAAPALGTPTVLPGGRQVEPAGQVLTLGNLPFSCALAPDGRHLAVLHGGKTDHGLMLVDTRTRTIRQTVALPDAFHGLAWGPDGMLWVSGGTGQVLHRFRLGLAGLEAEAPWPCPGFPAGIAFKGQQPVVADNAGDRLYLLGPASRSLAVPPTPYATMVTREGRVLVSSWGAPLLTVLEGTRSRAVTVGSHPTALAQDPRSGAVVVANANSDTLSVLDPACTRVRRTLALAAYPGAPPGASPTSLAFGPDGRLYVGLAGVNAIAVLAPGTYRELGRIPTAWYPSGLAVAPDGRSLYVISAKGLGSGPRPGDRPSWWVDGTLQFIPTPDAPTLQAMTRRVRSLNRFDTPRRVGWLPPIRHVVYVVRENRTFDQVLGDLPGVDGDPRLTLYGASITPNLHALASRYAVGDRFYCDAEVSAQGHQWAQGAYATDTVERLWPPVYANRGRWVDGDDPLIYPDADYLIDRCVALKISCRMYGDYLRKGPDGKVLPHLRGLRPEAFRGWDLAYSDVDRVAAWAAEFEAGIFPAFSYVWLPNDHTAGTRPGALTPRAMVAQNDLATGQLVERLSRDPRWRDTLVMIQEDDAQAGYDHVDGHRSVLVLASPWIKGGTVTSRHYSQASLVATVAALLRLGQLNQHEATSPILDDVWTRTPELEPFTAVLPAVDLTERNAPRAPMASASVRFDFRAPDAGDQRELARILWRAEHPGS